MSQKIRRETLNLHVFILGVTATKKNNIYLYTSMQVTMEYIKFAVLFYPMYRNPLAELVPQLPGYLNRNIFLLKNS